jgi:formylglycine-generating enzyme
MPSWNLAAGIACALVATSALAADKPPTTGIYPDVIHYPVPADISSFKQPASLLADIKAIKTGTLQQRIQALKAMTLRDLVFVKGGSFLMGDFGRLQSKEHLPWDGHINSSPLHKVTLTSYSISKYKVTRAQIVLYSEANHLPIPATGPDVPKGIKLIIWKLSPPSSPIGVTWNQAKGYCRWLGKLTGKPFALPTEAQWEYAARDRGRFILFATDNGKREPNRNVPTSDFTEKLGKPWHGMHISIPSPVGLFPPSPLGLYGMTNGQYEWVRDWFSADYYSHSKNSVDPTGPRTGTEKVVRGGGILYVSTTIHRYHRSPKTSAGAIRCVLNSSTPVKRIN